MYMHVTCSMKCKLTSDSHIIVASLWKLTQSRKEAMKKTVHSINDYKSYYWIAFSDKYIYQWGVPGMSWVVPWQLGITQTWDWQDGVR